MPNHQEIGQGPWNEADLCPDCRTQIRAHRRKPLAKQLTMPIDKRALVKRTLIFVSVMGVIGYLVFSVWAPQRQPEETIMMYSRSMPTL